jgi:spore germination protein
MTLTSYSIVTVAKDMAQSAGTGAWLTVLVTALVFSLAAACAAGLGNLYKGKMLFDYAPPLIGRPLTLLIVFFYILYFLFILVFLVTSMTKLTNSNFLLDTPPWALAAP